MKAAARTKTQTGLKIENFSFMQNTKSNLSSQKIRAEKILFITE
jgi:hypothetical protein